ncbi:hypothetical protein ONS95_011171 [Cadophora gregata]|uniref:uncharacterized protein n=1 Tax=Cadophora gregata TaxID=51156 RepID=UPI0026DB4D1B|nr:uncharacterized protein ONS95_011171 [Cadophora gregata]KAK0119736.1 hypothetical protein ONS95_011171 [Cadophora gregata]KAK0120771.1 hypothetical protein ONS96_010973 [Cadophora gregata f. sp. sojae]
MIPLQAPSVILLLIATHAQYVHGNPARDLVQAPPAPSTCGPTIATVGRVTTITIESIITLTHSCYTQTLTTKPLAGTSGCPTLTKCGPHPDCIIISTQTVKFPSADACCTSTPTSLVPGPCPTCQTGCDVSVTTAYITESPVLPTGVVTLGLNERAAEPKAEAEAQAAPSCYTTVINTDPIPTGATQTVYPATTTKTSLLDCKGCGIVTKFLNGFGPASQFKGTTTAVGKTTTVLAYACI